MSVQYELQFLPSLFFVFFYFAYGNFDFYVVKFISHFFF